MKFSIEGADSSDFKITAPKKSAILPGKSAKLSVVFAPKTVGLKQATLLISSNDVDEPEFTIALEANALPIPKIEVYHPQKVELKDNKRTISFGNVATKSDGRTKTFTIKNSGIAPLTDLAVRKNGRNKGAFQVGALGALTLAPGQATTFSVTFNPSKKGNDQRCGIHILSNDTGSGKFDIKLTGNGVQKRRNAKDALVTGMNPFTKSLIDATLGFNATQSNLAATSASVEVLNGKKYLALTVTKNASGGIVEVSPDLIDWYSGQQHTTILIDDATTLKVRDNTPVSPAAKRYIRYQ